MGYRIACLPGDGVGKEVMDAALMVLEKLELPAEFIHGDVGWEFWRLEGDPLPQRTRELLASTDCCLFGAITSKPKEEAEEELVPELRGQGLVYFSPIVRIRQEMDLFANVRPCKAYPGNPLNIRGDDIDLVVFRENTEGLYSGVEYHPVPREVRRVLEETHPKMSRFSAVPDDEIAISTRIMTRNACERIVRAAFEYAKAHKRPTVTLVEKPNVLRETGGLMTRVAREVASGFPEVELWETNIDAMCMWLVKNPNLYDVIVSENMFGDILSDLCAQLVGGLGFASSANIGQRYALFEPTHGSAPKYAAQNKVNPLAMLLTSVLMLDWIDEKERSRRLESAIAQVIDEGKSRTYDMGGTTSLHDMAKAVAARL